MTVEGVNLKTADPLPGRLGAAVADRPNLAPVVVSEPSNRDPRPTRLEVADQGKVSVRCASARATTLSATAHDATSRR